VHVPRLLAFSDLHVGYADNRALVSALTTHADDWLIVAGDVGETEEHLRFTWDVLGKRFARLIWTPGNHELWTVGGQRGVAKYERMVEVCREFGVLTPEDPYVTFTAGDEALVVAPVFALYDYSFRPPDIALEDAIAWAAESGVLSADERNIDPTPFASAAEWSRQRVAATELRLRDASQRHRLIIVSHFPLRRDVTRLPRIPRFSIWCGTQATERWHTEFRAAVVVSGHLHMPASDLRDGVRFEEVSVGYPRQQRRGRQADSFLREILPGEVEGLSADRAVWRW
jgi:predicted phosphodiesterase